MPYIKGVKNYFYYFEKTFDIDSQSSYTEYMMMKAHDHITHKVAELQDRVKRLSFVYYRGVDDNALLIASLKELAELSSNLAVELKNNK